MMKKNFLRMKQLADQTFLGAGKTKELDDKELEIADERVESLKKALVDIHKRINYNSANANPSDNVEKRMKRYPEYQLALTLQEHGHDAMDHLFGHVAHVAAGAEQEIAKNHAEYDRQVEELVIVPVQDILDRDVPNINKNKNKLAKYILDKDATRNRYNKNGASSETIKEDMEGADQKVEQTRDSLAVDLFTLLRKENELAQIVLQLLKLQKSYHYSALNNLEHVIPELEKEIGNSKTKPVFGVELEEHLRVRDLQLAYPLQLCVTALSDRDRISEEGLFRISGSSLKVKRLKLSIDSGCFQTLLSEYDNPVLASTLKSYLRELPDPLLTYSLHDEWLRIASGPECDRLKDVQRLINKLPQSNRTNLGFLIQFLARVLNNSENKMTASNIAIVISPNLLWSRNAETNTNMLDTALVNVLVEFFVKNSEILFPDDLSHLVLPEIHRMLPAAHSGTTSLCSSLSSSRNQLDSVISDPLPHSLIHMPGEHTPLATYTESPKPHNRRKQKPAPTPPVIEHIVNHQPQQRKDSKGNTNIHYHATKPPTTNHTADSSVRSGAIHNNNNNNHIEKAVSEGSLLSLTDHDQDDGLDDAKEECNTVANDDDIFEDMLEDLPGRNVPQSADKPVPVAAPRVSLLDGVKDNITSKPPPCDQHQLRHHHTQPQTIPSATSTPGAPPVQYQSSTLGRRRSREFDRDADAMTFTQHVHGVQLRSAPGPAGAKPTIPVRPASLKPIRPAAATIVGSTPSPSTGDGQLLPGALLAGGVNATTVTAAAAAAARSAGHDSQLSEKERFLLQAAGNSGNGGNGGNGSNGGNGVPIPIPAPAPRIMSDSVGPQTTVVSQHKSSVNGNTALGHARTRSDGNIVDLSAADMASGASMFSRTPPSPRPQLAKPSQPPPPPPTPVTTAAVVTTAQKPPKTDSTDL